MCSFCFSKLLYAICCIQMHSGCSLHLWLMRYKLLSHHLWPLMQSLLCSWNWNTHRQTCWATSESLRSDCFFFFGIVLKFCGIVSWHNPAMPWLWLPCFARSAIVGMNHLLFAEIQNVLWLEWSEVDCAKGALQRGLVSHSLTLGLNALQPLLWLSVPICCQPVFLFLLILLFWLLQYFPCLSSSIFRLYLLLLSVLTKLLYAFKVQASFVWSVCFYVLGISKYYLSSTVLSAVTMATSTGFSSCAELKNVKLTYNAVSLMRAAGPHCCSAAKTWASHIPVNSLYTAVLLSTLSPEGSERLLVLATIILSIGSTKYSFVFSNSKR